MMKLLLSSGLILCTLTLLSSAAQADDSLGDVIRDNIRREIRDDIRDSVRRDVCRRREDRGRNTDLCDTLEDVDQVRDRLRKTGNFIRTIDAIF
jgi:hypothetical protein